TRRYADPAALTESRLGWPPRARSQGSRFAIWNGVVQQWKSRVARQRGFSTARRDDPRRAQTASGGSSRRALVPAGRAVVDPSPAAAAERTSFRPHDGTSDRAMPSWRDGPPCAILTGVSL